MKVLFSLPFYPGKRPSGIKTHLLTFCNVYVAAVPSDVQSQRLSVLLLKRVPGAQAWGGGNRRERWDREDKISFLVLGMTFKKLGEGCQSQSHRRRFITFQTEWGNETENF